MTISIAGTWRALDLIENQWQELLKKIDDLEQNVSRFSRIIQKLEIIKLEAETSLTVSGLVDVTGAIHDNFAALGDMIQDIDDLEIVPITDEADEAVGLLLNIRIDDQDTSSRAIE